MTRLDVFDDLIPDAAPPTPKKRKPSPVEREYVTAMAAVAAGGTFPPLDDVSASSARPADSVVLIRGDTLTPQPIEWLWPDWLARGKLHVLAGAPGQGKTTLALAMAATVTIGGRFPDGSRCQAGNALIWSGEDDPSDTLLPRLIAAGADRSRIFFVDGARIAGQVVPFDPSRDLAGLLDVVREIGGMHMLIVDPIVSAVTGDSHKNTEVRRALQPLVDLAAITGAAVLGISHFAKGGQGQDPTQRVVGSVAFSAVARVVLVAAKVKGEDGEDARVLARSKSNIGPDDGGFLYHLEQIEALPGIHASRIGWGKAVAGSARDLLTDPAEDDEQTDTSDACELLRAELVTDTWTNADEACKPLKDAGFSKKQIWAASKKLAVVRKKGGMKDGWYWRLPDATEGSRPTKLPEDSLEDSEGSNVLNVESSESSGALESSAAPPSTARPACNEERF